MLQVSGKAVVAALEKRGWVRTSTRGSHVKLRHRSRGLVIVPIHGNRPLPPGTLHGILQDVGLSEKESKELL